jgi:Uma2 family endonuclease
MAIALPRYRISVDEFDKMVEAGAFHPDARIELIRGEIIEMAAQGAAHVACVGAVNGIVTGQLGRTVTVLVQCAIRLPEDGEPAPDFALVRRGYDRRKLPMPPDILVVMEVSDSSLAADRAIKVPMYAEAAIPEAWIFDLPGQRIERHTDPGDGRYRQTALAGRGERLTSTVLPTLTIDVDEAFGSPEH